MEPTARSRRTPSGNRSRAAGEPGPRLRGLRRPAGPAVWALLAGWRRRPGAAAPLLGAVRARRALGRGADGSMEPTARSHRTAPPLAACPGPPAAPGPPLQGRCRASAGLPGPLWGRCRLGGGDGPVPPHPGWVRTGPPTMPGLRRRGRVPALARARGRLSLRPRWVSVLRTTLPATGTLPPCMPFCSDWPCCSHHFPAAPRAAGRGRHPAQRASPGRAGHLPRWRSSGAAHWDRGPSLDAHIELRA